MPKTARGAITLAEEAPTRRHTGVIMLLVVALVAVGLIFASRAALTNLGSAVCRVVGMNTEVKFNPTQLDNAATITAIALERGLPPRAATIAIATAIQESKLQNIDYGDRDSVGLFQQRPSQGWGTVEQIMDPEYATNAFYDALIKVKGYESMEITQVAQEVQRSAYPTAYADHETEGRVLASALSGYAPGDLGCRMEMPTAAANEASYAKQLRDQYGLTGTRSGDTLVVTAKSAEQAWSIGSWSVSKAQTLHLKGVTVGDRKWTPSMDSDGWLWQAASPAAANANTVVIALR